MRGKQQKNGKTGTKEAASQGRADGIRREWPLLIYPALFLATLAVLYVMNQSIRNQAPAGRTTKPAARTGADRQRPWPATTGPLAPQDRYVRPAPQHAADANDRDRAHRALSYLPPKHENRAAAQADRSNPAGERRTRAALDELQGPDRIIALLGAAVSDNDHARIKECLDQLVAMGDAAVIPLNDLIGTEDETALWAAEALARIGTPTATSALLDALAQTKEGPYKEEFGKRVSGISNHDSWPVLLDSIMQSSDATVLRAAGAALARMADTPIVDAIVANYEAAATEEMLQRLTQLISNIQSPKATEALLALAGDTSSPPQDSLQQAALDALARIGDPQAVSHLLRRLEASAPGEGTEIFNAITRIESPEAHIPLLYAAAGNKEVSAEGRTAAIYALKNYPSEKTIALLESIIAQEDNDRVRSAATRTLDDLRMAPHAVTAKSDPTVKEDHILPPLPEKK
jgi:HEAT repeat protein